MSINWYIKSQGPKKKCTHFTKWRIHSCPADTARNQGSFTTHALWSVKSFNSPTVHIFKISFIFFVLYSRTLLFLTASSFISCSSSRGAFLQFAELLLNIFRKNVLNGLLIAYYHGDFLYSQSYEEKNEFQSNGFKMVVIKPFSNFSFCCSNATPPRWLRIL